MQSAVDEATRQRALDVYRVVDSLPEAAYEDIVRIAAALCDVPVALISLVDRDRQWFKARTGFEATEGRRDEAFCDHAIRQPDRLMEVPDTTRDDRFAANPLVTGAEGIRFYAGMPLVTPGGAAVGTVCVIDREPRTLSGTQRDALAALARLTVNLFDARQRELMLDRARLLAAASTPPPSEVCTVAIAELQGQAAAAARIGERALEKEMVRLVGVLEAALPGGSSVNRASASPEIIIVLESADNAPALDVLEREVARFNAETDLCVLLAAADQDAPNERPEDIFVRADEALSKAKDRHRLQAG